MQYFYEEGSVGITGIEKQDFIERMHEWMDNDEVTKYMVTGVLPGNIDKLAAEYDRLINGDNVVFAIKEKKSAKTIGIAGLYDIKWQPRFAEFRILIGDPKSQGKGIGTIVGRWIVKYAFERLNLNKVWLGVNSENAGAVKCYENAGFVREGVLRDEVYRNGRYYDAIRMSVVKEHGKA